MDYIGRSGIAQIFQAIKDKIHYLLFSNVVTCESLTIAAKSAYNYKVTLSAASTLSISGAYEGFECCISILNSSSSNITQPLPSGTGWQCDVEEITIEAGKIAEISVRYIHGIYYVKA
jgi:hypothetical protein